MFDLGVVVPRMPGLTSFVRRHNSKIAVIKEFVCSWVPERAANSLVTCAERGAGWGGCVWSVVGGVSGSGVVGGTLVAESWAGRWRCNRVNDRARPRPRARRLWGQTSGR